MKYGLAALKQVTLAPGKRKPDGMVTIGSDPKARTEAIEAVMAILRKP